MRIADFNAPAAENILKIINDKGLKQKAVAEKAGYSSQQFCGMLNAPDRYLAHTHRYKALYTRWFS